MTTISTQQQIRAEHERQEIIQAVTDCMNRADINSLRVVRAFAERYLQRTEEQEANA